MTRFARKGGLLETKESKKKKLDATEWKSMVDQSGEESNHEDEELNRKKKHEEDYNKKIEQENSNSLAKINQTKSSSTDLDYEIQKYSKTIDKEVLDDLLEMKKQNKLTEDEFIERLHKEARSNQRRLNRQNERETGRICFKCRRPGHAIDDCPEMKRDSEHGSGICYKCGSTEHAMNKCKVKLEPGQFPYAKCFICNEMGHITKQCPDNPRGLYPNGGCCKNCGSVEHYRRDCPEAQKQNLLAEEKTIKKARPKDNLEDISDDDVKAKIEPPKKNKKVVVFK